MQHYDGTGWKLMPSFSAPGKNFIPRHIWGSSARRVLAAGNSGALFFYDGNKWSSIALGTHSYRGLWGHGASDVWLISTTKIFRFQ